MSSLANGGHLLRRKSPEGSQDISQVNANPLIYGAKGPRPIHQCPPPWSAAHTVRCARAERVKTQALKDLPKTIHHPKSASWPAGVFKSLIEGLLAKKAAWTRTGPRDRSMTRFTWNQIIPWYIQYVECDVLIYSKSLWRNAITNGPRKAGLQTISVHTQSKRRTNDGFKMSCQGIET